MISTLATLAMASLLASPFEGSAAVELRYRGALVPLAANADGEPVKQFNLYTIVRKRMPDGHEFAFIVDENGGGQWAWPERYGSIALDGRHQPTGDAQIRVLYLHEGTPHPLPLRQPLFEHSEKLSPEAEWEAGGLNYRVIGSRTIANRECWGVEAEDRFNRVQSIWVDKASPLLIASEHDVTVGRGERFRLEMELESAEAISADRLDALDRPLHSLLSLQEQLKRPSNSTDPELNDRQLAAAKAQIDAVQRQSEATPFEALAKFIGADVKFQLKRSEGVGDVARQLVGGKAPVLDLVALDESQVEDPIAREKIVVLHFWKYRGDPPQEPYGQVGYLDFLHNRRSKLGVEVYGVAVDPRVGDSRERKGALRQIRKLTEFMNLSYPIAIDDGTLLSKFGDPRRLGAKLPVWVVIGPDSRVAHYHVGFYEIGRDQGLRELDDVVVQLIKQAAAAD